jgi:hypothetical protein
VRVTFAAGIKGAMVPGVLLLIPLARISNLKSN